MNYLAVLIWNIFVLSGSVYLYVGLDRSGWWIVLGLLLLGTVKKEGKVE